MQPARRWVPPRAARPVPDAPLDATPGGGRLHLAVPQPRPLNPGQVPARDLAFCAEFAVHGGLARSQEGFKGEADLIRMQQSGLLDLVREQMPPFNVIEVRLSQAARRLLDVQDDAATMPAETVAPPSHRSSARSRGTPVDQSERRSGFEVARGMIGAAVNAEIAAWTAHGSPGGMDTLEQRIMARIVQLKAPFPT